MRTGSGLVDSLPGGGAGAEQEPKKGNGIAEVCACGFKEMECESWGGGGS